MLFNSLQDTEILEFQAMLIYLFITTLVTSCLDLSMKVFFLTLLYNPLYNKKVILFNKIIFQMLIIINNKLINNYNIVS